MEKLVRGKMKESACLQEAQPVAGKSTQIDRGSHPSLHWRPFLWIGGEGEDSGGKQKDGNRNKAEVWTDKSQTLTLCRNSGKVWGVGGEGASQVKGHAAGEKRC